jgi:phosphoglycolate phosphatase
MLKAVLFDFDYTLADSSTAIVACVNAALVGMGLPPAPPEHIRPTIGLGLPEVLRRLAGPRTPVETEDFVRRFIAHADRVMADGILVYPTVPAVVGDLRRQGLALGIVSTKFRRRIEAVLAREGLAASFAVVVGGEDVAAPKPDPAGLLVACGRLACAPSEAVYVGDTTTDAEAASRAGMPFAAVLSGVTPPQAFASHPVATVLADLGGLPGWTAGRRGCGVVAAAGDQEV